MGLLKAEGSDRLIVPEQMLREESVNEFVTYATGRQNVAFVDIRLVLAKRYNPLLMLGEAVAGILFDSMAPEKERMEITAHSFDGKENSLVPQRIREAEGSKKGAGRSEYDGFVWAVLNKDLVKRIREERYDLSLTTTKDHPKLPPWCTVMSENAEITENMLTPELVKAIEQCDGALDLLVVTDQPADKPKKYAHSHLPLNLLLYQINWNTNKLKSGLMKRWPKNACPSPSVFLVVLTPLNPTSPLSHFFHTSYAYLISLFRTRTSDLR